MLHYYRDNHGFNLVELLISISIVFVILTVVISNQSTYTDSAAITNLADEIGLTIFQAQTYGIAVKEFSPGSGDFTISYGLTFSLLGSNSGSNTAYISFADRNDPPNGIYDGDWTCPIGGSSECLQKINISRNNILDSICVVRTSGTDLCNVERVDISFVRPNPKAQLAFRNNGGNPFNPANIQGARIVLRSPGGLTKSVLIYETGQISIQ